MRILWLSNAPHAPSGYGQQTALFLPRLKALGHDVAVVANYGVTGKVDDWNGFTVYPSDGMWGNKTIGTWAEKHQADLVIALCDAFVLNPDMWPDELRMAVWAPVDHNPIPPPVLGVLNHDRIDPVAMSRFGEEQMNAFKLDPVYVPHGIDTRIFRPRPELRDQARDALQIPKDAFLVGMVAANKGTDVHRKAFPQALYAFSRFAQKHQDAWMYVHTEATAHGGQNLDRFATFLHTFRGMPDGRLRFPSEKAWHLGISQEILALFYQAFDVLLSPSMGEGFGIPILEAQACGCPVISSDHSAMSELTQAGWLVQGDPWWDEAACAEFFVPSIDSIVAALEAAYADRENMELREAAAEFAATYDADAVAIDFWQPALERLVGAPVESRQVRRARERREAKQQAKVAA